MKLFNRIICILFILFCVSNAFSNGNDFSGGGDPDAVEYLGFLKKVPRFLFVRGLQDKLAPSQKVQDYIRKVKVSLDDEDTSNDLIQFQSEPVVVQGVEKVARFDSKIGRVTVHRGSWHLYKAKKQGLSLYKKLYWPLVFVGGGTRLLEKLSLQVMKIFLTS